MYNINKEGDKLINDKVFEFPCNKCNGKVVAEHHKKYYLDKNLDRYLDYQEKNPNTLISDKYQTSVFVKDEVKINDTINDLMNLGYNTYAVKDMLINESATMTYIYNIIDNALQFLRIRNHRCCFNNTIVKAESHTDCLQFIRKFRHTILKIF